jgi:hypothetical protein
LDQTAASDSPITQNVKNQHVAVGQFVDIVSSYSSDTAVFTDRLYKI